MKKIFILTGEPSGDKLAAEVIKELKKSKTNIEYLSVGGQYLNSIGIKSIYDQKDVTYIAFTDILFNVSFAKLSIVILSTVIPIYMLMQKDILVIDILIEKASFLLVSIFALIGFYLEFYILELTKIDD